MTEALAPAGAAEGGGSAPRPAGSPRRISRQDERGAGAWLSAPLFLFGAAALGLLWLATRVLPGLPDLAAAALVLLLGAAIALPDAWAAAVRRGHGLGMLAQGGRLRGLGGGAAPRVIVTLAAGSLAAFLLLIRLAEAGLWTWLLAASTLPVTWGLMRALAPRFSTEAAGLHARRLTAFWARLAAVAVMLALAAALSLSVPPPLPAPDEGTPAAPLVSEALALARLWAGLEVFALGEVAEFGTWGRGLAALVAALGLAGVSWALASLAVAMTLPRHAAVRALAPASDAAHPPPVGWPGPVAALLLAACLLGAAAGASGQLAQLPLESRPSARAQVAVEVIGEVMHAAGTRARIDALRAAALAEDIEARAALRAALDAGFDAMEGNVDAFLDDFYTLSGEYGRLMRWAFGRLEAHMTAQLTEALQAGAPFARLEAEEARFLAGSEARAAALREAEAQILAESRVDGLNPARLRITARHGALPLPPELAAGDLARAELRWGVSAGTGIVAAAMAQRVAGRLAARGVLATAARMVARVGGLVLAFGLDYALLRLDEYQNREDFREAILAEIATQRAAALSALE